jgi:serine/threonine protein kinase
MQISRVLQCGIQLCKIFLQIHAAGWVWRDCKPVNILVTPAGELRPLDFEGACPIDQPDPMFWGTPGFTPPQRRKFSSHVGAHEDLYALGSMLYLLLTGRIPETTDPIPIAKLRRNVPQAIQEIVLRLLGHDPKRRPTTETVYQELKSALVSLSTSS